MSELEQFSWDKLYQSRLEGKPLKVVTRDGHEVTQIVRFDGVNNEKPVRGAIDGKIGAWFADGRGTSQLSSSRDLFFAPRTRTVWHATMVRGDDAVVIGEFDSTAVAGRIAVWKKAGYTLVDEYTREIPA